MQFIMQVVKVYHFWLVRIWNNWVWVRVANHLPAMSWWLQWFLYCCRAVLTPQMQLWSYFFYSYATLNGNVEASHFLNYGVWSTFQCQTISYLMVMLHCTDQGLLLVHYHWAAVNVPLANSKWNLHAVSAVQYSLHSCCYQTHSTLSVVLNETSLSAVN